MNTVTKFLITVSLVLYAGNSIAQSDTNNDVEELKLAALEALIMAPPERALPLVRKVLEGDNSDEMKESALFILSQIDLPEAQTLLLETARQSDGELMEEAIRMLGISGDPVAMSALTELYNSSDEEVRAAVLEAYMIAGDENAIYEIAANTDNEEDFEEAVEMLAAMGASEELRKLREAKGLSESLIDAYAISGDAESLRLLSMDDSDPALQLQAIEALGIVGGEDVNATLIGIYRNSNSPEVREAAMDGLFMSGDDQGVLELYRASQDAREKKELLGYLVMMDSEAVWDVIDSALDGER